MKIQSVFKLVMFIGILWSSQLAINAQTGRKPTTFPNLPNITDNTLLFTQDAATQESYKFTIRSLKDYIFSNGFCLGPAYQNTLPPDPESPITLQANAVGFEDVLWTLTHNGVHACDATTLWSIVPSNMQIGDGQTYHFNPINECTSENPNNDPNWEFSLGYPINTITNGIIDKVTVRIKLFANTETWTVLTLKVNNSNVASINTGERYVLSTGTGNVEYSFTYKNADGIPISSLSAGMLWWDGADFDLDGIEVICDLKGQNKKMVLSTDADGCLKMETIEIPNTEQFNIYATNGLSLLDNNTVKLGGNLNESFTAINGDGNNTVEFNNLNQFRINNHYYDATQDMNYDSRFEQYKNSSSLYAAERNASVDAQQHASLNVGYNGAYMSAGSSDNTSNFTQYANVYVTPGQTNQTAGYSDGTNINYQAQSSMTGDQLQHNVGVWDNENNISQSGSINMNHNSINQSVGLWNNNNSIYSYVGSYLNTESLSNSVAYNDNINNINTYSSVNLNPYGTGLSSSSADLSSNNNSNILLNPSTINMYTNDNNNNNFSTATLSTTGVSFSTSSGSTRTYLEQTKDEIGIRAIDDNIGHTQLHLTPLKMYLRTHNITSNSATTGQVLTLKDATTGEVEFEDAPSSNGGGSAVNSTNGIIGDGTSGNPLKLGGALTEYTPINGNQNSLDITNLETYNLETSGDLFIKSTDRIRLNTPNLQIINIGTDNSATQVLGKNSNGNSVWRDVNSLGGTNIYNSNGTLSNNRTLSLNGNDLIISGTSSGVSFNTSYRLQPTEKSISTSVSDASSGKSTLYLQTQNQVAFGVNFGGNSNENVFSATSGIGMISSNTNNNGIKLLFYGTGSTIGNLGKGVITSMNTNMPALNFAIDAPTTIGGKTDARAELDIIGTGAIIIPVGTSSERPLAPVQGMERFNSTFNGKEIYDGINWIVLSGTWTTTNRPTGIGAGSTGFNTSLSQKEYWNGTSWVQY